MIIYSVPRTPFGAPVKKRAMDAAAANNVRADIQYADDDVVKQNTLTETRLRRAARGC